MRARFILLSFSLRCSLVCSLCLGCSKNERASFPPLPASQQAPAALVAKAAQVAPPLELLSAFEAPLLEALLRAYLEDHPGADVRTTRLSEVELEARLASGEAKGDVVLGLSREDLLPLARLGRLATTRPAECSEIPAQHRDPAGQWIGLTLSAVALGIHEPQLREKQLQIPREWKELVHKQFHGWAVLAKPAVSRSSRILVNGLTSQYYPRGWDLWKRIDKNLFQYTPGEEDAARMVGSGESTFAIDFDKRFLAQQQAKKPVVIHYPSPTYYDVETVAQLAGSKNPTLALRFTGWLCGTRAMQVMDAFRGAVTKPFFESTVPGKRRASQIRLEPLPARALTKDAFLEEWRDRYGK